LSPHLTHDTAWLFLTLGLLLAAARTLGEVARRLRQPAVLGEILAGVLLGPTVLGHWAPHLGQLAPRPAFDALTTVAIVLFLLLAGLDVQLSTLWRQRATAVSVGLAGLIVPFLLGFGVAWQWPQFFGRGGLSAHWPLVGALFFGTALAISALPVIARLLRDLKLYRSDVGTIVIAAAVFQDLLGWTLFTSVMALAHSTGGDPLPAAAGTFVVTLAFVAVVVTAGRWLPRRATASLPRRTAAPGALLAMVVALAFVCAALTESAGLHAVFGAFVAGIALGGSPLGRRTRRALEPVVTGVLAPLFFAGIGLKVDCLAHLDVRLAAVVVLLAVIGKVLPCGLAARWCGLPTRESWAVAFCLNSRGAMEIILGVVALQVGLITESLFVALVLMALVTTLMSGAGMGWLLRRARVQPSSLGGVSECLAAIRSGT
jgi:Kef-type K+ transport system membrane component KefB